VFKFLTISLFLSPLLLISSNSFAHGKLNADELKTRFTDTTQHCRKEKDQSTCTTYFAADGSIKRRMHEDGKRRGGSWNVNQEKGQLCITWTGKKKALCFDAYMNKDGTMDMYKRGKHLSTVITFFKGNVKGL
jgi:acetyl/propionyl-CoA carboxylase alpha subunit